MINKTTRFVALGAALLFSSLAQAQEASPSGSPAGSPSSGSSDVAATTTTTTTTTAPIMPADGTGIEAVGGEAVGGEFGATETLPATGGAPLLMVLAGAMTAGGALLGLKKVR